MTTSAPQSNYSTPGSPGNTSAGLHLVVGSSKRAELLPQHVEMLTASAIASDIVDARGYRSIECKAELKKLGFSDSQLLVPTLLIPIWGVNGEIALYHHRPDMPRTIDEKASKYEFPARSRMAVDVHPFIRQKVGDPHIPLFITEGVKKADAAVTAGLCCLGLTGVWNWRGTNDLGGKSALADWESVALKDQKGEGRQTYICFDSDVMVKAQVHQALARLSEFLKRRGAKVAYIYLPTGEGATKVGLDDFLAAGHDVQELMALSTSKLREIEGAPSSSSRGPSQATRMVDLALADGCELFHAPDGEPYASINKDGHTEVWPLWSKAFSDWLGFSYYAQTRGVLSAQTIKDSVATLSGKARYEGTEESVYLRLAKYEGDIYLDLADAQWRVVRITPLGWEVVDQSPVRFKRTKSMLPLPVPEQGKSINELWRFANVTDERERVLLAGFLVGAMRPESNYPLLIIGGEQGSAKSSLAEMVRALIDPNGAPLRSAPRNEQDLMIASTNMWLPTFDNLSQIPQWLSDAMCRLATGGGLSTRELYANAEETIFNAARPVVITSVEDVATRSDLLDRSIILSLRPIPDVQRQTSEGLRRGFEAARPRILGGILDAVSTALRNLPHVKLSARPRMADFAEWCTAAEPAFSLQPGQFLEAYSGNRANASSIALDAEPAVATLMEFVQAQEVGEWQGTATELQTALVFHAGLGDKSKLPDGWPKGAAKLSSLLKRVAPNLRQLGIDIRWGQVRAGDTVIRQIIIRRTAEIGVNIVNSYYDVNAEPERAVPVEDVDDVLKSVDDTEQGAGFVPSTNEATFSVHAGRNEGVDDVDGALPPSLRGSQFLWEEVAPTAQGLAAGEYRSVNGKTYKKVYGSAANYPG